MDINVKLIIAKVNFCIEIKKIKYHKVIAGMLSRYPISKGLLLFSLDVQMTHRE